MQPGHDERVSSVKDLRHLRPSKQAALTPNGSLSGREAAGAEPSAFLPWLNASRRFCTASDSVLAFNTRSGTVIGMAITSQPQRVGMPLAIRIESVRLPQPSWVKTSQIRVLSTERLGKKLGRLSAEELE
jgi:mRNA-degrading endonuclease toxin of MazEF toxin-antitoxin module